MPKSAGTDAGEPGSTAPEGERIRDRDGYAELRSYGAIGDGRTVALIARDGQIDWLPIPSMDSPPVFSALLDADNGGCISLRPVESFTVERAYVGETNVLATTFRTASGSVRVTDSLNTGVAGRLPWAELARRIDGLEGSVRMTGEVKPGTCMNTSSAWTESTEGGPILKVDGVNLAVRTLGALAVTHREHSASIDFRTTPGSRHLLGVVGTEREPLFLPTPEDIDAGVDRTVDNWTLWSSNCRWEGEWGEAVRRSALAMKLLIYAPTGALVAASTTSLPESTAGGKNWDYRFAWVRDMAYSLTALFRFGLREETHAAISWLLSTIREHGPEPRVLYRLDGSPPTGLQTRDVPGWRGIGPVLSGNGAADQLQLGVFGDLFSIVKLYVDNGNVLDTDTGRSLASIADLACDRWHSKDSGMWELEELRHYTTSKLGCWQALMAAADLADRGHIPGNAIRWRAEAEQIRSWVRENAWSEDRRGYVWYPGSDKLDASILLHAVSGFDRGPRMRATISLLRKELGVGPHLYRYTGAEQEEASFVACSFWMVSALHLTGQRDDARMLMAELVRTVNDVGLLAEMIDPPSDAFSGICLRP